MNLLRPDEIELTGQWLSVAGKMIADATCERIQELTSKHLIKISVDQSGWLVLYRDPQDSRLWELSRPHSQMHGGGPPKLTCISAQRATDTYGRVE